jgi:hypothetical protein
LNRSEAFLDPGSGWNLECRVPRPLEHIELSAETVCALLGRFRRLSERTAAPAFADELDEVADLALLGIQASEISGGVPCTDRVAWTSIEHGAHVSVRAIAFK